MIRTGNGCSRGRSAFTISEVLTSVGLIGVAFALFLGSVGALLRLFGALDHGVSQQAEQMTLHDYLGRDLRCALSVSLASSELNRSAGGEIFRARLPDSYTSYSADPFGFPRYGSPRNATLANDSVVSYGSGNRTVVYTYQPTAQGYVDIIRREYYDSGSPFSTCTVASAVEDLSVSRPTTASQGEGRYSVSISSTFVQRFRWRSTQRETTRNATEHTSFVLLRNALPTAPGTSNP